MHRFEREFAAYVGAPHALALSSCTAGLHLALLASDIGAGHEVITTPLTFCATANVVVHVGARPVFADIDETTWNLDPRCGGRCDHAAHAGHHPGALRGTSRAACRRSRRLRVRAGSC